MTATTCAQNPTVTDAQCADGLTEILRRQTKAVSIAEVAELLSVSRTKVHALVQSCSIPFFRIGSSIRFDPKLLADWLESKQVQ